MKIFPALIKNLGLIFFAVFAAGLPAIGCPNPSGNSTGRRACCPDRAMGGKRDNFIVNRVLDGTRSSYKLSVVPRRERQPGYSSPRSGVDQQTQPATPTPV